MSGRSGTVLAVDLGATSGRVMAGRVDARTLELEQLARFGHEAVPTPDGLQTDLLALWAGVLAGLSEAGRRNLDPISVGVDSWAVDYGLLRGGRLLAAPMHYRDDRNGAGVEAAHARVPLAELYAQNGLQFLPFTTLYQLLAEQRGGLLAVADQLLLLPDLVAHWLGAEPASEVTNASTTGLLTLDSPAAWNGTLVERLGLPRGVFAPLVHPGTRTGSLSTAVAERTALSPLVQTVAVGSHDTASAVVAVPMTTPRAAWISCGTWGLVGLELDAPVVSSAAREAGFTNELGVDGTIRFLHNVMGLWVLSQAVAEWDGAGSGADLPTLLEQAVPRAAAAPLFDVDHPSLLAPGPMTPRIAVLLQDRSLPVPDSPPAWAACIVASLAEAMSTAVRTAAELAGRDVDVVHLVGGGSLNTLLCQQLADRSGLPVLAGPVEATAMGNLLVQARSAGLVSGGLAELRDLVARTHPPQELRPHRRPVGH